MMKFKNEQEKINEIKELIDTLRIYINQDGGDLEFIGYENNVVTIRLLGACVGCSAIDITYESGLKNLLRDEIDPKINLNLIVN